MSSVPDPFTTPDLDVRHLDGFMMNTERLLASELWALSTGEEFKAAMGLWCRAWKQLPAGSLPNDQRVLASFAGVSAARWRKISPIALRGFVLCSDGRLYHRVLCEDVRRAHQRSEVYRGRAKTAADARWKHAPSNAQALPGDAQGRDGTGTGQGQGQDGMTPPPGGGISPRAAPAATAALAKRIQGVDSHRVRDAITRADVLALVEAFGCDVRGERAGEWLRDTDGMQIGEVAAVLAWRRFEAEPVRQPSGFRSGNRAWCELTPSQRKGHMALLEEFGFTAAGVAL